MQKACETRFIFITGGVMSSLGKGVASASLGALLRARGFRVRLRKLDPYINVDSGTMSPYQHGEVFVTDDGAETDLDLGHYERFSGVNATKDDCVTTGKIYLEVIKKERAGDYLGQTVQIIPHITDQIKEAIKKGADDVDFVICEIGGTVGDIESLPFLEAIRQTRNEIGPSRSLFIHLALIAYLEILDELKTKPAQHSVKELQRSGIQPDILICRCERPLSQELLSKMSLFCNVPKDNVIAGTNVSNIYYATISYHEAGLDKSVCKYFGCNDTKADLSKWHQIADSIKNSTTSVKIAIVGKYIGLIDAYKSLIEALSHAGIVNSCKVDVRFIDGEKIEQDGIDTLNEFNGIIIAGGFGHRGTEGKIMAIRHARENNIPIFGICLGMQLMVIEALRNICGVIDAGSSEFGNECSPVIGLLEEWMDPVTLQKRLSSKDMGGTMRLGAYKCILQQGSKVHEIYHGSSQISERHRHRYEVNGKYENAITESGMSIVGKSDDGDLVEIIERSDHKWFIGVQYHPELKSRPFDAHPLFVSFIKTASCN